MIYLASPYTHPERSVRNLRYLRTRLALGHFMKMGLPIYSPIVHCHHVAAETDLPTTFEFWIAYNNHFMDRSEALWIFQLDGWFGSSGIKHELNYWRNEKDALGVTIKAVHPETFELSPFMG